MSLCQFDVPAPDQELVDKYEAMKGVFYKRLLTAYGKLQAAMGPVVESLGEGRSQAAKDYVEDMQTKPQFQAVVKVATWVTPPSYC